MAKVVVVGLGYVGLTTALGLANLGHSVIGIDTDAKKLSTLSQGKAPFFEEGVEELLKELFESGRISFRDAIERGTKEKAFYFLCVPTPIDLASETDMTYFESAVSSVVTHAAPDSVLVIKSTVPIGTASSLRERIVTRGIEVANNPEFLKEGTALRDFESPNRIVVGATNPNTASEVLDLYEKVVAPKLATSLNSAETIKYASNAYLALRISFFNELATASELIDADLDQVLEGVSLDERIGKMFMSPGPGWGGSCFPKDTKEYLNSLSRFEFTPATVASAVESNREHQMRIIDRARNLLGGTFRNKKVAIWGLAFKANTDDLRDSPSLAIARSILAEGATIAAYDPMVSEVSIPGLEVVHSPQAASNGADLIMVMTEWDEFKHLSPAEIRATVSEDKIFDTRRVINSESWEKHFGTVAVLGES